MGRGVLQFHNAVSGPGQYLAIAHQNSAHRHFLAGSSRARFLKGHGHEGLIHEFNLQDAADSGKSGAMTKDTEFPEGGERIAKYLARAGVASRRECERLIEQGVVTVDGVTLTSPAFKVTGGEDIRVDGSRVGGKEETRLFRFHKPSGLVTTHKDPEGRPTVFDALPKGLPRLISIGRLDLTTEGLLLLTNDGALARHLELPATGWVRRYRVRVYGRPDPKKLEALTKGITVDGVKYEPIQASLERSQGANAWLKVALKEGKNREIRNVMEALELKVNRLIRVSYGPFQLGSLPVGEVEEIPRKALTEQIGTKWMSA